MAERYILITGASKGIGRAAALHLDKLGFHVLAGVRKLSDGEALCREASARLRPIQIDVTDPALIASAAQQITQIVGDVGLYGLVNNAGIAVAAPLEFIPLDDLRWQLEVNVVGQVAVTQAFIPLLRQARGRIVNISSIGGLVSGKIIGPYHASKYALEALNDALRQELKPWGIEVVAIQPGEIATPIWDTATQMGDAIGLKMPAQWQTLYGQEVEATRQRAFAAAKNGAAPELVAQSIGHALTAPRPRTRYLVGRDAQFVGTIIVNLSARLRDRLMAMR